MRFESSNKKEKKPQTLEEMMPFLKPSKEEIDFNQQVKKSADLLIAGRKNEAIELSNMLREKQHKGKEFTEEQRKEFIKNRAALAEQLGYEVLENKDKWFYLKKGDYNIEMKNFMTPSGGAYANGRIDEIFISSEKDNSDKLRFFGGKVTGSKNTKAKKIFDEIVNYFN